MGLRVRDFGTGKFHLVSTPISDELAPTSRATPSPYDLPRVPSAATLYTTSSSQGLDVPPSLYSLMAEKKRKCDIPALNTRSSKTLKRAGDDGDAGYHSIVNREGIEPVPDYTDATIGAERSIADQDLTSQTSGSTHESLNSMTEARRSPVQQNHSPVHRGSSVSGAESASNISDYSVATSQMEHLDGLHDPQAHPSSGPSSGPNPGGDGVNGAIETFQEIAG